MSSNICYILQKGAYNYMHSMALPIQTSAAEVWTAGFWNFKLWHNNIGSAKVWKHF